MLFMSWLPTAAELVNIFISSSLQHLVLSVKIRILNFSHFTQVDFSPLAVLGAAAQRIPRIDLYVHTDILPSALTRAQLLSSLEDYEDIIRSIKDGILVIHSEEIAPEIE
jgi:hypothetical protein